MKKLSIKLSYADAVAISDWTEWILQDKPNTFAQKSVWATIQEWRNSKIVPATYFPYSGKKLLKLNPALASAIAHYIQAKPVPITQFLGNRLNQLLGEIDRTFK